MHSILAGGARMRAAGGTLASSTKQAFSSGNQTRINAKSMLNQVFGRGFCPFLRVVDALYQPLVPCKYKEARYFVNDSQWVQPV